MADDVTVFKGEQELFKLGPCELKSAFAQEGELWKIKDSNGNLIDQIESKQNINLLNIGVKDS